jgi:mono/diheme cytochrome c family protein
MLSRLFRACFPTAVAIALAVTAYAGGWATVTVRTMPEYFVVGKTANMTFFVRQHGVSPLDGLSVSVRAAAPGGLKAKAIGKAASSGVKGEYVAALTLPAPGLWTIEIDTGWPQTSPLLPIAAIQQGVAPPAPLSEVARGERLFVSKACITCHVNQEVAAKNLLTAGPELTGRTFPADYLRKFLADPAATLGKMSPPRIGEMPNQELTTEEIAAIVAFINRERPRTVSNVR